MRRLFIFACLPLLALDNSKTLHNQTAGAITSRAQTLHFYLAQGEITNFPRPYLTPSDTGTRAAAANWQADVKQRWRDGSSQRSIAGVLSGHIPWSTGGGGLNSIVECSDSLPCKDTATITMSYAHNLSAGDRLVISGGTGDVDINRDHYTVVTVPSATTVTVNTQNVSPYTFTNAGLVVRHVIEPAAEPLAGSNLCRIKSPNHRLEVSEQVTIAEVVGMDGVNGTWYVSAVSQNEFLINTTCSGTFSSGGYVIGPDFGSVKAALVSFTAGVPASGSLRVDIVNSTDPCHLGDSATCRAAGLDKAGMLAFNGGTWDASLTLTANVKSGSTAAITRSARTMLTAWNDTEGYCRPRYSQRGPVVTKLILEYACQGEVTSNIGWKIVEGGQLDQGIDNTGQRYFNVKSAAQFAVGTRLWFFTPGGTNNEEIMEIVAITGNTLEVNRAVDGTTARIYSNGKYFGALQWEDTSDPGYQNIHPAFALTFNAGWAGVKIETRVENVGWDNQLNSYYAWDIAIDGVSRRSSTEMKHNARTRWRKTYWSGSNAEMFCIGGAGTDPDACSTTGGGAREMVARIDHNTDYLTHAKALLSWPRVPTSSTVYWHEGFSSPSYKVSDKGDIGVDRWIDYRRQWQSGYPLRPYKYMGTGTWGADSVNQPFGEKGFPDNYIQEGWALPVALVLWVQSWDAYGYNLLLGTSLEGGGGNAAVENYIPLSGRENSVRPPYVAGWPDSSYGRWISNHVRAGVTTSVLQQYATAGVASDQPKIACWSAPNTARTTSTISTISAAWPCSGHDIQGTDGYGYETAHMNQWSWLAWLVTGDDWWSETLMAKAAYAAGVGQAVIGRNVGKIWGSSMAPGLIRSAAFGTQEIQYALSAAPTEQLYGQISTPERNLMLAYGWDDVYFSEGLTKQTDGWAALLYGPLFDSTCVGYPTTSPGTSLGNAATSNRYRYGRCSPDLGEPSNPLGFYPPSIRYNPCSSTTFLNCVSLGGNVPWQTSFWQITDSNVAWHRSIDLGFPGYTQVRRMLGRVFVNATLNANFNGYLPSFKDSPSSFVGTLTHPQSWAEMKTGYLASKQNITSFSAIGGSATLTNGYSYRMFALASFFTDIVDTTTPGCTVAERPPVGCTGRQAYDWYLGTLINQRDAVSPTGYPKSYLMERQQITNVAATWSAGTASLSWVAPSGGGCTVSFNPVNSLDTGESTATAVGRIQTFSGATTAGSTYRISCGQARYSGNL